jgi:hypothetical protein
VDKSTQTEVEEGAQTAEKPTSSFVTPKTVKVGYCLSNPRKTMNGVTVPTPYFTPHKSPHHATPKNLFPAKKRVKTLKPCGHKLTSDSKCCQKARENTLKIELAFRHRDTSGRVGTDEECEAVQGAPDPNSQWSGLQPPAWICWHCNSLGHHISRCFAFCA